MEKKEQIEVMFDGIRTRKRCVTTKSIQDHDVIFHPLFYEDSIVIHNGFFATEQGIINEVIVDWSELCTPDRFSIIGSNIILLRKYKTVQWRPNSLLPEDFEAL